MILGYGILAVPTGIVSAEIVSHREPAAPGEALAKEPADPDDARSVCHACGAQDHPTGANFCYVCGSAVD